MSVYVIDTAALVDLMNHFPPKRVRKALRRLCQRDQLRFPEGVFREIRRKSDKLKEIIVSLEKKFPAIHVKIGEQKSFQEQWVRIECSYGEVIRVGNRTYPGFWHSQSGRRSADAQLVAVAKVLNGVVVSSDRAVTLCCMLENVAHVGWAEFARQVELVERTLFDR